MAKSKIAIIGSGMAGATLAYYLQNHAQITVFEKSRGVGGRLATRYTDDFVFDHGAPFFRAKHTIFKDFIQNLVAKGIVKIWQGRFAEINSTKIERISQWDESPAHFIGSPKMTSVCKFLLQHSTCHLQTKIEKIKKQNEHWEVFSENEYLGKFDWVISTIPPAQALSIIPRNTIITPALEKVKMQGCFSLMIGNKEHIQSAFDMALVRNSDISWLSFNNTKHNSSKKQSIIALSTNNWADIHMEISDDEAKKHLLNKASEILQHDFNSTNYVALHKWRYANIKRQSGPDAYIDHNNRIAACGDWCKQGIVEAAYLSALYTCKQLFPTKIKLQ
jgi:predicted NAD/FAD-dependent oxidoreductase